MRPDVPRRQTSMWPPGFGDLAHFGSREVVATVIEVLDATTDGKVTEREHVGSAEDENEVHLTYNIHTRNMFLSIDSKKFVYTIYYELLDRTVIQQKRPVPIGK